MKSFVSDRVYNLDRYLSKLTGLIARKRKHFVNARDDWDDSDIQWLEYLQHQLILSKNRGEKYYVKF